MTTKQLRLAIERSDLSKAEIVRRARVSNTLISAIASGSRDDAKVRPATALKLRKVLATSLKAEVETDETTVEPIVRMTQIVREVAALKKEFKNLADKVL